MKKQLALKGHKTRGEEIIKVLQNLGGKKTIYRGTDTLHIYSLDDSGEITTQLYRDCTLTSLTYDVYTLEEFLEEFPFKIHDKVTNGNYSGYGIITEMVWDCNNRGVKYCVKFEDVDIIVWLNHYEIKFIGDELFREDNKDPLHELCENMCENKLSSLMIDSEVCGDEVELILNNYEIVIKDGKTFAVKKKPKYPTTYEECCKTLGIQPDNIIIANCSGVYGTKYENNLIDKFGALWELIICRDAYRKIYSEQMGLEKPWEPNYISLVNNEYFTIHTFNNEITKSGTSHRNAILSFPTEELRDIFFENFKDIIENCKKLL